MVTSRARVKGPPWGMCIRFLLGHLCDVLVTQRDPQVIVLIQKHLLHTCLSNAAGLISAGERTWVAWVPTCLLGPPLDPLLVL